MPVITNSMMNADMGPLLTQLNPLLSMSILGSKMDVNVTKLAVGNIDLSQFDVLPTNNGDMAVKADISRSGTKPVSRRNLISRVTSC